MSSQQLSLGDGKQYLPVHAFPDSLEFYADDPSSHKQIVTLCNPYDCPLKFRVLCTASKRYILTGTEGTVLPRQKFDIAVRHVAVEERNVGAKDRFRIQVEHKVSRNQRLSNTRDIMATLHASRPSHRESRREEAEHEESASHAAASNARGMQDQAAAGSPANPHLLVWLAGLICIIALMLPTHQIDESDLPSYLHLNYQLKLCLTYTLGLITMVVLRQ